MPTGVSQKRYRDKTTGEWVNERDTLVAQDVVDRLASRQHYAPMSGKATLENIRYSFVADGKDLLINLDEPDYAIEKTNLIVTVKDVADLNGNRMASPVTMDIYVYRNPLRWDMKQLSLDVCYGVTTIIVAKVVNHSGRARRFTVEGLPVWVTASQTSGTVGPLGEQQIEFTISPYINIGDYDEVIYIVGEDGMTEPLALNIKVRGDQPDWKVDQDLQESNITMSIIGEVEVGGSIAHDPDDMLAAFDENHRLMGVTHLSSEDRGLVDDGLAYLTVYNNDYKATPLFFEFFDASTGIIHEMAPMDINFKCDTVIGTSEEPVFFECNNGVVQAVQLKPGWNWVSFNVEPVGGTVKSLFGNATHWQVGDALELEQPDGTFTLLTYKAGPNPLDETRPLYSWDCADSEISIDPAKMYRFYSNSYKVGYFKGYDGVYDIEVHKGWNRIGYVSKINLPLGTAMAQYADLGKPGDIIKSQSQFAILSLDGSGNKFWKGTLSYLRVGEGYMLKSGSDETITFNYPYYQSSSRYGGESLGAPAHENVSGTNMTVVARAEGAEVQPGDRLVAYRGMEVCGIAEADEESVFYLVVGGSNAAPGERDSDELTFTLERDEEVLAVTTSRQMTYRVNDALGTPDAPTTISFLPVGQMEADSWYDLGGVKLTRRPSQRGIYIHNHEKVFIK